MAIKIGGTGPTALRTITWPDYDGFAFVSTAAILPMTAGDLFYASSATAVSKLAKAASGNVLLSGNAPSWGKVDLTAAVSGILPSANGGTGNGFAKFTGPTTTEKTFTLPDATCTILTTNALVTSAQGGTGNGFTKFTGPTTSEKTFTLPDATCTILTSNAAVTVAQGGTGLATLTAHALYVGNGTSAPTALAVGATGAYLRGATGADPVWSTLLLPNSATAGDLLYATGANAIGNLAVGAAGTVLVGGSAPAYSAAPTLTSVSAPNLYGGGTTSSYPQWKRSSALWQARLGDDSAYASIEALTVRAGAGSASAPSYAFQSATDFGMYDMGSRNIGFGFQGTAHVGLIYSQTKLRLGSGWLLGFCSGVDISGNDLDTYLGRVAAGKLGLFKDSTHGVMLDLGTDAQVTLRTRTDGAYADFICNGVFPNSSVRFEDATKSLSWNTRTKIFCPADGVLELTNAAENDFARLQFGGTTSSFPALKRSATILQARLADDSGYCGIEAASVGVGGPATVTVTPSFRSTTSGGRHVYGGLSGDVLGRVGLEDDGTNGSIFFSNDGGARRGVITTNAAGQLVLGPDVVCNGAGRSFGSSSDPWANLYLSKFIETVEMTAPSAPAANGVRIYAVDNGSGKTQLMALFASGAAQQIAIQP